MGVMSNDYIPMEKFSLKWLFTNEKYNVLPKDIQKRMHPLSVKAAKKRWESWISIEGEHYCQLNKFLKSNDLLCADCGWGDKDKEQETKTILTEKLLLNYSHSITFFWHKTQAIETEWGIFLDYWSDFCYPDDDSNIVIINDYPKAIIYITDSMWVVDRKVHFGESKENSMNI